MINLYSSSTIGSYTTGKVTCTKNSATVTGTGTTWSEIVNPGDILTLDDDKFYIISAVNSNTSLTLDKNFAENTATNVSYRILLNTAAHFPSDTAAKVERALEQLSDINEAAINNNRTVTAATKINGKGIESTSGNLLVYPASVNTNQGGILAFHYNQSNSTTSSVYEDQSGRVRINGNFYVSGDIQSRIDLDSDNYLPLRIRRSSLVKGTAPSETLFTVIPFYGNVMNDNSNSRVAMIQHAVDANNVSSIALAVYGCNSTTDTTTSSIRCYVDGNGNAYTSAPTPATNDNSNKIATTAYTRAYTSATYLPLTGGTVNTSFKVKGAPVELYTNTDTTVNQTRDGMIVYGPDGKTKISTYRNKYYTNGTKELEIFTANNNVYNSLTLNSAADGTRRCYLNYSPATNSNSNDIATTAFVNNRLPYTSGTWTPVLKGATTAGAFTYTAQSGTYMKIGHLVYVEFTIACTVTTVPTGYFNISGLPYGTSTSNQSILINIGPGNKIVNIPPVMFRASTSGVLTLYGTTTGNNAHPASFSSSVAVNTSIAVRGSGIYRTNS